MVNIGIMFFKNLFKSVVSNYTFLLPIGIIVGCLYYHYSTVKGLEKKITGFKKEMVKKEEEVNRVKLDLANARLDSKNLEMSIMRNNAIINSYAIKEQELVEDVNKWKEEALKPNIRYIFKTSKKDRVTAEECKKAMSKLSEMRYEEL